VSYFTVVLMEGKTTKKRSWGSDGRVRIKEFL
jgi:hypothetical protein